MPAPSEDKSKDFGEDAEDAVESDNDAFREEAEKSSPAP